MAPLPHLLRLNKLLLLSLFASTLLASFFFVFSTSRSHSLHSHLFLGRRHLLANNDNDNGDDFLGELVPRKKKSSTSEKKKSLSNDETQSLTPVKKKESSFSFDDDDKVVEKSKKKKSSNSENAEKLVENEKKSSSSSSLSSSSSSKNQTKITKAKTSSSSSSSSSFTSSKKDETKLTKPTLSSSTKNKTKLIKPTSSKSVNNSSSNSNSNTPSITKLKLNKLNSTKPIIKKPLDLLKSNSAAKNKTKSSTTNNNNKSADKTTKQKSQNQDQKGKSLSPPSWTYQDNDDEDLVSEFRDLPIKFHQSFIPDLHRISTTSKVYLTKYNKEFTKGFKPYVGNKYAASLATAISCIFIIVPFLLVSLLFNRIKAYFSLQKLIIFIQIYLSIYFSILCLSSLITGLEPLRFFYATSQSTYIWLQVLQTLAYVLYLLLLLMYLVLVFSTETELGQKFLGLAQTLVGFAVGLHYYMTVFHRVVLRQPPKTNWKIHGIYATCFLVICVFAGAERRKKAYLVEGSEEAKTS